ncbi:MAG TPA: nucleoside-diphosphate sugar epimerase/dehydratase [Spirochaetales bacterium]|nr:nucleoside-diphosphate sugar epimerase/dehydratase [Spirochaetales bacterium]
MNHSRKAIIIIGAGIAGTSLAKELMQKSALYTIKAFLDDDPHKIGSKILGIPVIGPVSSAIQNFGKNPQEELIIAIPSADNATIKKFYNMGKAYGFVKIHIIPSIATIIEGEAHAAQLREINPQEILGRKPSPLHITETLSWFENKRILVTGAGGSIGSELCRQLLEAGAERLYLFGHGENSIYTIDRELRELQRGGVGTTTTIVPIIGELRDRAYIHDLIKKLKVNIIFHTAAYKHVPLMEQNPVIAIENNVLGTKNLVDAAIHAGTKRFIFISTDKAVDPICIYGASKLIGEHIVLDANKSQMEPIIVRFGNVLGSRGSIIPLFQRQIQYGGPFTVTHPDATRYFMTIPEACSLVLKTAHTGKPGESYIFDMGYPVRIIELAENVIKFYGYEPYKEIPIEIIGLRPGEKIHESLIAQNEYFEKTEFERISLLKRKYDIIDIENLFKDLGIIFNPESISYRNAHKLYEIIKRYVPTVEEPDYVRNQQ